MDSVRTRIWLRTGADALAFVQQLSSLEDSFSLENRTGRWQANAKSVLGVLCIMLHCADDMYLINNTHDGVVPACVTPYLCA